MIQNGIDYSLDSKEDREIGDMISIMSKREGKKASMSSAQVMGSM